MLVLLLTRFFPTTFARQSFLRSLLFAGLQVKGVALDLLDNVFLLYLALKTAERILDGLAVLNSHLGQKNYTPKPDPFGQPQL